MTYRELYTRLIRCHPSRFREQFEAEMLATFDDASRDGRSGSLLLDAVLSLFRQWAFRPGNWMEAGRRVRVTGGLMPLEEFRSLSEAHHRRAWRVNLGFLLACLIVLFNMPSVRAPGSNAINGVVLITFVILAYRRHKNGTATLWQRQQELSIVEDPRRSELVRKRDSLRIWVGGGTLSYPWEGPVTALFIFMAFSLGMTLLRWPANNTPRFWICMAGTGVMVSLWYFVRRLNHETERALQQEIDAIDDERRHPR